MVSEKHQREKVPFESALDQAGIGTYSYLLTLLTGVIIVSFSCIAYSSTMLVPASACELETTPAQQGVLAAAPLIGSFIGSLMWGYLGDTRGRHNMLVLSIILGNIFNLISSISVNWVMMMIMQFIATLFACGMFTLSMTLLCECVPLAYRNVLVLVVTSFNMLSQGVLGAIAIPILPLTYSYYLPALDIYWNSWRTVLAMYSVPSLVCLICLYFVHESPKFLLFKGEEEKALQVLRSIHKTNNWRNNEELQIKGLQEEDSDIVPSVNMTRKEQLMPLFRAPLLKYITIIVVLYCFEHVGSFVIWLPTIANQFITILETGEGTSLTICGVIDSALTAPSNPNAVPCALNTTALVIVIVVSIFQSTVNILVMPLVNRTGRRNMVLIMTSVFGLSGILINLVPNAIASAIFFAIFMLGLLVHGLYVAMCMALFPTQLRAMAMSVAAAFSRLATFASIQVMRYFLISYCNLGFYIFASLFAVSSVVASFLPDDRLLLSEKGEEAARAPLPAQLKHDAARRNSVRRNSVRRNSRPMDKIHLE